MQFKVIAHPEARRETAEAGRYYEAQSAGLSGGFFSEVEEYMAKVLANPLRFAIRTADVRRANLKRFPYHLNYFMQGDVIALVAVSHDRQRPFYWRDRLKDKRWLEE